MRRGGVLYVPMMMASTPMRTHPLMPKTLGESTMILVMPVKAPSAIAVLQAGSVASSNLSSMEKEREEELDQFC